MRSKTSCLALLLEEIFNDTYLPETLTNNENIITCNMAVKAQSVLPYTSTNIPKNFAAIFYRNELRFAFFKKALYARDM